MLTNSRPLTRPMPVPPATSQAASSPSRSHSCSSTPRRSSSTEKEECGKPRWSNYVKGPATKSSQQVSQTRIPRLYGRGKENIRGRGARVVKPVQRPKLLSDPEEVSPPGILTRSFRDNTAYHTDSMSTVLNNSKSVPDLHQKILAKIRLNKRRSHNTTHNQSPCKAPAPPVDLTTREEFDGVDRDSPVSVEELETYLTSMFNMVDTYRTGLVTAGSLLEYLSNLVDLPRLDKWKLEELCRILDPNMDNRYVDRELWSEVGKAWAEMIMDPENHSDSNSADMGNRSQDSTDNAGHDVLADVSYGSIEGLGGVPGCSSREVELENKVSELRYQLSKLGEEKREVERNLAASEEFGQSLTTELEGSHRQMASLSTSINKSAKCPEEINQVREVEQQCCNLEQRVQELNKELHEKEDKMADMEVLLVNVKGEFDECKEREECLRKQLNQEKSKCSKLEEVIKEKIDQVKKEIEVREEVEEKFLIAHTESERLKLELSIKEEEIKNLTHIGSRLGSVGSSKSSMDSSNINDVSVDDKVIEENFKSHSNVVPVFLPRKLPLVSPMKRGPSASSTPNKATRMGSIAEEFMEVDSGSFFPSPFCEKEGSSIKKEVLMFVERIGECVRKIMMEQVEPKKSGQVMATLNREIFKVKGIIEDMADDLPSKEELRILQENNADLEQSLSEAKVLIQNLKNDKDIVVVEPDLPEDDLAEVSIRVDTMASILQSANSALLALTHETSAVVQDCSLDGEMDLSSWQLDLEGIQLMDLNTQLSRKLIHYSKCGKVTTLSEVSTGFKSPFPTEISKSPVPNTRLWQSLYKRLEDLQKASEVSRDLLLMAGDSLREQSMNQSTNIAFPQTKYCQTESVLYSSKTSQTVAISQEGTTKSSQTDTNPPETVHTNTVCQMENCFCPSSQARASSSMWRVVKRVMIFLLILVLIFTFCCGIEIDHDLYYPITWYPLRRVVGGWLPAPMVCMSYMSVGARVW